MGIKRGEALPVSNQRATNEELGGDSRQLERLHEVACL
jgi:hypothetical protein